MDLNQKDWKNHLGDDSVIIDVRTPEEFEISRIPDSINIDFKFSRIKIFKTILKVITKFNFFFWFIKDTLRKV